MKTIIFDVDDTLYDQKIPFEQAFKKNFSKDTIDISIEKLYRLSRKYSDQVFDLTESGEMGLEEMHIYRIKEAFNQLGKSITPSQALGFQKDYEFYQKEIKLVPYIEETLNYCLKNNIQLGIITNGPKKHQQNKIKQLNIQKWIPKEHIFISSDIGLAKPDIRLFKLVERRMLLDKHTTYFVGDSYQNDILGAKNAGWQTIWINRRNIQLSCGKKKPNFNVTESESLLSIINSIN